MTMFQPGDFESLSKASHLLMTDPTPVTAEQGDMLNQVIRGSGKTRPEVVVLLKADADLHAALGCPMNLGILVSATMGTVVESISDLILKKVAEVVGATIE